MYCADAGAQLGITFASYGTPNGGCGQYVVNASCNTPNSLAIVQGFCNGKQSCTFNADTPTGGDREGVARPRRARATRCARACARAHTH